MLSSFRSFMRVAAAPSYHRGCSILGCGTPEPRFEAPIVAPEPALIAPQYIDEAYQQLKRADERFRTALIQFNIAKKLLKEAQEKRSIDGLIDLKEEVQANLMKNFCSLLTEKEDQRLRGLEKRLYHGPLTRDEMAQRRLLRRQQISYSLEIEEAMFMPTSEIASAQQMAYDEPHEEYTEIYQAHNEAFKMAITIENLITKIQKDLTRQKAEGNMLVIAPGGPPVPNFKASIFLDKMNQLTTAIVKLSQLERFSLSTHFSESAQKIDIEFAKHLLNKARLVERPRGRLPEHQYEIQAWNAVLNQLLQSRRWKERRRDISQLQDDIKKTIPRIYSVATEILTGIKVAYGKGGAQMIETCIPDFSDQIWNYADKEKDRLSSEDEEKW